MTHTRTLFVVVMVLIAALVGCARPAPSDPAIPTLEPTEAGPSVLSTPVTMPTAAPLWTATAVAISVSTQAESDHTEASSDLNDQTEAHPDSSAGPTRNAESPSPMLAPGVIASVNDVEILRAHYDEQLAQAQIYLLQQPGIDVRTKEGQAALQELEEKQLQWMIDQEVIAQAAAGMGLTITEDQLESQIEQMRGEDDQRFQQWLAANGLTEESLREQLYDEMVAAAVRDLVTRALKREVPQVRVRHILLSDLSQAQTVRQGIGDDRTFISAAFQYSEDLSTKDEGGDLGFLPRGVMPPAFETVAFSLQRGEISDIVHTDSGYHILQMIESDPARPVPDALWPAVQQYAFGQWLVEQRTMAQIIINK